MDFFVMSELLDTARFWACFRISGLGLAAELPAVGNSRIEHKSASRQRTAFRRLACISFHLPSPQQCSGQARAMEYIRKPSCPAAGA